MKEPARFDWLQSGGEMGAMVARFDWSTTPLGPIADWPSSLKTTVATLLHSRHPMFLWWGPELTQIYNDAYLPSFGLGKHPASLGQPAQACWPEIWPIIGPQIDAVMTRGEPSWHEDALVPIFRNGRIEEVFWTYGYSPVFDDESKIAGTLVVCTETTTRVQSIRRSEKLRLEAERERARFLGFCRQAPAAICILRGDDLVFDFANEAYLRLVGREQLEGQPLLMAMPELAEQGLDVLLRNVIATGKPYVGQDVLIKLAKRGAHVPEDCYYTFNYSPHRDARDLIDGVIVLAFEVTEQVKARRQSDELARAKDDFLTTASHELRTPLNAILGWARLLRAGQLDASRYLRAVETIERNANVQERLIEDILDGSRILSGKLQLEIRTLDLAQLVQAAMDSVRPAAEAKRITLSVNLETTAARVTGDPERLQQVIWNLVSNAIKFTPKEGSVEVSLQRVGTGVELKVKDNGQGIDPGFLPFVFERFRQAEGSTTRRHGGLGLGLALVRHLVEAHGGSVRAESAGTGLGSTFTVTLPIQAVYPKNAHVERKTPIPGEAAPMPLTSLSGVKVLVVDDEADARDLVTTSLELHGAQVTGAPSVARGLELLGEWTYHILVSDIGMPEADGYQLIRAVRTQLGARGATLPAIALTAYAREQDRRLALEAGFSDHVAKPVDPNELVRLVVGLAEKPTDALLPASSGAPARPDTLSKFEKTLATQGLHQALRFLNSRSTHRFTGLYRFDPPMLRNVLLLDTDNPALLTGDDAPLNETYCSIVGASGLPFTTEDARLDPRLATHPAREAVVSYCGVLVRNADGTAYGTLCHFDTVPCDVPTREMAVMEAAAAAITRYLARPTS